MSQRLLANAFSINMTTGSATVQFTRIPIDEARAVAADCKSVVGHPDTAAVFADVLGFPVACHRATVELAKGDRLIVGQYKGDRLPAGAHQLPPGATIEWFDVQVLE